MDDENGEEKVEFGGEKRASRILCWMKVNRFNTNFHMQGSKISDISEKRQKMAENIF